MLEFTSALARLQASSKPCFVYLIVADCLFGVNDDDLFKVGVSYNPALRLRQLLTACPHGLRIASVWKYPDRDTAVHIERAFHDRYADWRVKGEWFAGVANGAMCDLGDSALWYWVVTKRMPVWTAPDFLRFVGLDEEMIECTIGANFGDGCGDAD